MLALLFCSFQSFSEDEIDTRFSRFLALKETHQYLEAKAEIESILTQAGDNAGYLYEYARILAIIDPDNPKAVDLLTKAVALAPEQDVFRIALAEAQFRVSQYENALSTYRTLLQKNPMDTNVMYRIASIYSVLHEFQSALRSLDRILEIQPGHLDALAQKGRILIHLDQYQQAEVILRQVVRRNPSHFIALVEMGKIYIHRKEWPQAERVLLHALDLYPFLPELYTLLAGVYTGRGQADKAKTYLKTAQQLKQNSDQLVSYIDHLFEHGAVTYDEHVLLGMQLAQLRRYRQALVYLNEALRINPGAQDILIPLTSIYLELGEYETAYQTIDTLTDNDKRFSPEGLSAIGWAAFHTQRFTIVEGVLGAAYRLNIQSDRLNALHAMYANRRGKTHSSLWIPVFALMVLLLILAFYRLRSMRKSG